MKYYQAWHTGLFQALYYIIIVNGGCSMHLQIGEFCYLWVHALYTY